MKAERQDQHQDERDGAREDLLDSHLLANVLAPGAVLEECGATDLPRFHQLRARPYRRFSPRRDDPTNTLLVVDRRAREGLRLEIEAIVALE